MNNGTSQNEKNTDFKRVVCYVFFTDFSMCTTCFVFWSCHQSMCCKLRAQGRITGYPQSSTQEVMLIKFYSTVVFFVFIQLKKTHKSKLLSITSFRLISFNFIITTCIIYISIKMMVGC